MRRAKNKPEELEIRSDYDKKKEEKIEDGYQKLLSKVGRAVTMSTDPFYMEGFKERCKVRDVAWANMKQFLEIKPHEVQKKDELKEFNSNHTSLKKAIDSVDEYTKNLRSSVENLQTYIRDYPDLPLFSSGISKSADFNLKTAEVSIVVMAKMK